MHASTFKATLNFKRSLVGEVIGAYEGVSQLVGAELGALAAFLKGAHSSIDIDTDFALRSVKNPASPYKYAYQISKEFV
ncbi:hypothetical protein D3C81_1874070 [compost metagenome]